MHLPSVSDVAAHLRRSAQTIATVSRCGGTMLAGWAVVDFYLAIIAGLTMVPKGDALKILGSTLALSFLGGFLCRAVGPKDDRVMWNVVMAGGVVAFGVLTTGPEYHLWESGVLMRFEDALREEEERLLQRMERRNRLRRSFGHFKRSCEVSARERALRGRADKHLGGRRMRWTFRHWAARPGGVLARAAARRFEETSSSS